MINLKLESREYRAKLECENVNLRKALEEEKALIQIENYEKNKVIEKLKGELVKGCGDCLERKQNQEKEKAFDDLYTKLQIVAGDAQKQHEIDSKHIKELNEAVEGKMRVMEQQWDRIKKLENQAANEPCGFGGCKEKAIICQKHHNQFLSDMAKRKEMEAEKERDELKAEIAKSIPLSEVHDVKPYLDEIAELKARIAKIATMCPPSRCIEGCPLRSEARKALKGD